MLEDGRLTDGHGRTVDFRNCVLAMTSNLGSDAVQALAAKGLDDNIQEAVMEVVGRTFRPEFVNRIDEVVVFHALKKQDIAAIAEIQLGRLRARLADQDLGLLLDDNAVTAFGGARLRSGLTVPVRSNGRSGGALENPLSTALLEGRFAPGQTIAVSYDDGMRFASAN